MEELNQLREDVLDDIRKSLKNKKKKIHTDKVEKEFEKRTNPDTKDTNSNYNDGKQNLDGKFTNGLISYIDSLFPNSSSLGSKIGSELNKRIKDDKEKKKVQKRVRDTVYKEWHKFLDNLDKRMNKIQITSTEVNKDE
jgi:hypothetical protein